MFAVSMKIGVSRLYIVQRIKDFLKHVDAANTDDVREAFHLRSVLSIVFKHHDDNGLSASGRSDASGGNL